MTKHNQPRNYFSRREQYRLISLVFSLMLVAVLVIEAGKPANWRWFFAGSPERSGDATTEPFPVDTAFEGDTTRPDSLPPEVFLSPAERATTDDPLAVTSSLGSAMSPSFPTAQAFDAIKDDTVFRAEESAVWFELLRFLKEAKAEALDERSLGPVSHLQLHESPKSFRGKVIELNGTIRRAHRMAAPNNDYGIDGYWQCWLQIDNEPNPIVIYSLEMPNGFPEGMALSERADFRGVFFKRWAYASDSGSRVAPVVVAACGVWQPAQPNQRKRLPSITAMALIVSGCILVAAALVWLANRAASGPTAPRDRRVEISVDGDENIEPIESTTSRFLRKMTDDEV